jgi:uncharacterized membrane protein YeaQ/YmgE (transglycosylase-associated protein family)
MNGIGWLLAIIIGAVAGWIAEKIMKGNHGLLTNIILGIVGALVFNALLGLVFGWQTAGILGSLIAGVVGACLLIWIYRLVRRA